MAGMLYIFAGEVPFRDGDFVMLLDGLACWHRELRNLGISTIEWAAGAASERRATGFGASGGRTTAGPFVNEIHGQERGCLPLVRRGASGAGI